MENIKKKLLGAWHLISVTYTGENNEEINYFGDKPTGLIIYNEDGTVAAQFMQGERRSFSTPDWLSAPPDEVKKAFVSYQAYFGNYEIMNEGEVHHHVKGSIFPNWHNEKVTEIRYFDLQDNILTIKSAPIFVGGRETVFTLVWHKPYEAEQKSQEQYVYYVTVKIHQDVSKEWLDWVLNTHIADVMNTGKFSGYKFTQLLQSKGVETEVDYLAYEAQYFPHSLEAFETYIKHDAPALRTEVAQKYGKKMKVERKLLKVNELPI